MSIGNFFKRPPEHYFFLLALVIGVYTLVSVRASKVPTWDEILELAVGDAKSGPNVELLKERLNDAKAERNGTSAKQVDLNRAQESVRLALGEPTIVVHQDAGDGEARHDSLEPLVLAYPHFFQVPDYMPSAGIAPAVSMQERALRLPPDLISLAEKTPVSHFSDKREGEK